jgi:predicted nucleotidyltransferase component of viral defense system
MITAEFITKKAAVSQIDRYTIIRECVQLLFLRYFYEQKIVGLKSFFKGGTALRFLFGSFRFSEDLDFTCVGSMRKTRNYLQDILPKLEEESGFTILVKDEKLFEEIGVGYRLACQPNELIRQPLGIRLDFSFRERPQEPEVSAVAVADYPISPFPLVTHLSKKEILAERVRAILVREAPRDLFDLWFLLKQGTSLKWNFVAKKMKYYPKVRFNKEILKREIQKFRPAELKKDLNQFLPANYRNYSAKIIEELLSFIK